MAPAPGPVPSQNVKCAPAPAAKPSLAELKSGDVVRVVYVQSSDTVSLILADREHLALFAKLEDAVERAAGSGKHFFLRTNISTTFGLRQKIVDHTMCHTLSLFEN